MLKGLDVTEVMLGNLERTARFDAEFFAREHRRAAELMAKQHLESLRVVASISDGNHFGISEEFCDDGMPYYRGQDVVGHFFVEQSDSMKITREAYDEPTMVRSHLRRGDVLLSIIGSIGEASLVSSDEPATCSCKLAILRPKTISAEYLAAFLRSEFGRSQNHRMTRGAVQMGLLLEDTDQIFVPRFSNAVEEGVSAQVSGAKLEFEKSAAQLTAAEQTLLHALGLDAWQPPEPLTYVRRASEVAAAARFDSEFFAPRTLQLLAKLGAGGRTIRDVAPPRHEEFAQAGGPGEFDYIEIGSLRGDGTVGSERLACADAPSRATWRVRGGDVVTSTVRPNRRLSALIIPEQTGFVASSGFVVLQPKALSAEVLLTYLRLPPVCEVMDLHTSASLYPTISETDLLKLPFPKLDAATCEKVTAAVRAAHTARREAQTLLARAQRAVEIAIEQGEPAALKLLTH